MKKKILIFVMAFAIIFPAAFLLSACDGKDGKKVQSITVDNLFIGDSLEGDSLVYEYGINIKDIFSLETMEVTAIYDDNSTKVLSSDEYTVEFSKNTNPIDEIESVPDVGYYGISVFYEGAFDGITFTVIPSSTPYYSISLSHKSWIYGNDDIPEVTLKNYQLQEGESVDYYYIEKSYYDALSPEEKELANIYASDWAYIKDGTTTLDAGEYYVFAYINFANEPNYTGLTAKELITVNKKRIVVTPEDAAGVSAWIFDYSNSYNTSPDRKYIIGDIALKNITLDGNSVTISGVEGRFEWENPEQTLNSSNSGDSYPLVFIPDDSKNYEVDYSGSEIKLQVTIEKGVIDNKNTLDIYFADSESEAKTIAYDGKQHSLLLDSFEIFDAGGVLKNIVTFTQNGENAVVREETPEGGVTAYYIDGLVERGQYTFTVSIVDTTNYCWAGGDTTPATFTVTIE